MAFGSCRVAAPHEPPYSLRKDEDERGREIDALRTLALRMRDEPRERWPDLLLLLGDQVYADEVSPGTASFAETRRDPDEPPGRRCSTTRSTRALPGELDRARPSAGCCPPCPTRDDLRRPRRARRLEHLPVVGGGDAGHRLVDEHLVAAMMSYWVYQHIGNVSPSEHDDHELLRRVKEAGDGTELLREFASGATASTDGARWSYCRDVGSTRIVVIDSRAGRVLEEGRRAMVDADEWAWVTEHATGGVDHLLLATSLPFLLGPGMHWLEAWGEAVAGGAWGRAAARVGERFRRSVDLEHWAAFQSSFARPGRASARGGRGRARRGPGVDRDAVRRRAPRLPVRGGLSSWLGCAQLGMAGRVLALPQPAGREGAAGDQGADDARLRVGDPPDRARRGREDPAVRWRSRGGGPWFDNQVAMLTIDGRRMDMRLEKAVPVDEEHARLECVSTSAWPDVKA